MKKNMGCNLWFTSDSHFGHANFLNFLNDAGEHVRPFASVEAMDETMVKAWNDVVRPSDHIYHLGDVSMKRPKLCMDIFSRLNGHKRLVRGNHDIYKTREYLDAGFDEIYGVRVLDDFVFTHIPIHPACLGRFKGHVHGHIHERVVLDVAGNADPRYMNICVEQTNYRPVSFEEIRTYFQEKA